MNIAFDAPTHRYTIDGRRVPSVTEILAPQNDWSMVPAWQLEAARAVGRDVHEAVNLMVRNALDWNTVDAAIAPYVLGAERFLHEFRGVVLGAEQVVGSRTLGVAGTLDLLMTRDDWLYLIDWKVSAVVPSTVGAQLAAYKRLYIETFYAKRRPPRMQRACVRLQPDAYSVEVMDEQNGDWNLFQSCLNAFKHRERRSYA